MSQDRLHNFDQMIRDKFSDHELVPSADLWEKLETKRANQKKSDRKKVLLLVLLLGFLGWGGFYFFGNTENAIHDTNASISSKESSTIDPLKISEESPSSLDNEIGTSETSFDQDNAMPINDESSSEELRSQSLKSKDAGSSVPANNQSSNQRSKNQSQENERNTIHKQEDDRQNIDFSIQNEDKRGNEILDIMAEPTEDDLVASLSSESSKVLTIEELPLVNNHSVLSEKKLDCPVFKIDRKTQNISVEASVGPALSFHRLSSEMEEDPYLQVRHQTEEPLVNYGVNLRLKKEWQSHLTLAAGINATIFNYKYRFVDSSETRTTIITIDTLYTPQGQHIYVDTLNRVEYGIYEKKSFNKHRLISFPISVGYVINMEDFFIEPYAGVTLNWRQFTSGDISSIDDLRPMSIDSRSEDALVYKNNLGVMYHVGMSIGKNINDRLSIMLQPEFHKVMESISKENYPVKEDRDWINFNLGVKYKIWQRKHMTR